MNNLPEIYQFECVCVCVCVALKGEWRVVDRMKYSKCSRYRSRCDRNRVKRSSQIFVERVPKMEHELNRSYWVAYSSFCSWLIFNFDGSSYFRLNHFSAVTQTTSSSCIVFDFLFTFYFQHFKYYIVQHKLRFSPFKSFFLFIVFEKNT